MGILKGVGRITDDFLTEQISENVQAFFDWGLLEVGGFFNVKKRTGSTRARFRVVDDPNYAYGQVWQGYKMNWVWESGVPFTPPPIGVSGVYINNTFVPNASGGFHIDYPLGQIIFNSPKASTSVIEAEYAYRMYNFYNADVDYFQQIMFDPMPESGVIGVLAKNQVSLPAVFIENVPNETLYGYELGDYTMVMKKDILFHILANDADTRDKLAYIMLMQKDKTFMMYNTNKVADANRFPLDENGSVASGAMTYPQLVSAYQYKTCRFENVKTQEITRKLPLFRTTVRATLLLYTP